MARFAQVFEMSLEDAATETGSIAARPQAEVKS
jgi:hypothetical protein